MRRQLEGHNFCPSLHACRKERAIAQYRQPSGMKGRRRSEHHFSGKILIPKFDITERPSAIKIHEGAEYSGHETRLSRTAVDTTPHSNRHASSSRGAPTSPRPEWEPSPAAGKLTKSIDARQHSSTITCDSVSIPCFGTYQCQDELRPDIDRCANSTYLPT